MRAHSSSTLPLSLHFSCSLLCSCVVFQHDAALDSFLSALDAAQEQALVFAALLNFLALVQQPGAAVQPRLLGDAEAPGRLFIRDCYPKLWSLILAHKAAVEANTTGGYGALVSGNSGTGKTSFLVAVLKQLRSQAKPPTVVFEDLSTEFVYVFRPGSSVTERYGRGSTSPASLLDRVRGDYYLVDTGAKATRGPDKTNAFSLVVASPHAAGKELVEGWSKEKHSPPHFLMPCWTLAELQTGRQLIAPTAAEKASEPPAAWSSAAVLPSIDQKAVAARFDQYGGIARVAFASEQQLKELLKGLTRAYEECKLSAVARMAGSELTLLPETSSWLLHYDVDPATFQLRQVDFASDFILAEVFEKNAAQQHEGILAFVNSTSNNPVWSSAAGKLFETFLAHSVLQRGGSFAVQQFVKPAVSTKGAKSDRHALGPPLMLPASPLPAAPLPNAAAIKTLAAAQYGQPSKDNFPTIDGVLKPNLLFQMTVGRSHNVNIDGLVAAVNALQLPASAPPPRLYFVVPPQQFATFQVGTFTSSIGTPVSTIPANVEYWVLALYELVDPLTGLQASKRKQPAAATSPAAVSPPPSAKAAKLHRVLPAAATGTSACSCKGPCTSTACSCREKKAPCHAGCHSSLAKVLSDPLDRHKNCTNHAQP